MWFLGAAGILLTSCNSKYRVWVGSQNEQKIFNQPYGDHPRNRMDVFLPATYNADVPTVLMVHGGAWKYGRKEHLIMIQRFLFKNNIPTVNINYRLASRRKKITYKEQLQDIRSAIKAYNKLAPKAGLQPDNLIILGESAGAHLSLLYGYQHPEQIRKIISLSGPTDFYTNTYLNSFYSRYTSPTIGLVVGEKFRRGALSDEFRLASPLAHISPVPTLIFQGDTDILVNRRQGLELDSALTAKEIPHKLIYMKNSGHTPRLFSKYKRDSIIYPNILTWITEKPAGQ